jgi:hypothetical protein
LGYLRGMRSLRMILTLLLAVVWMPLAAHCQIESVTGLEVLSCAPLGEGGTCAGSPCDPGSCCSLESGQFRLPQSQPVIAAPLVMALPLVLALAVEEAPTEAACRVLTDQPPEVPKPWQFSRRAALPPRAPSIAS